MALGRRPPDPLVCFNPPVTDAPPDSARLRRGMIALAGPVLAIAVAAVISSLVLLGTGDDVAAFWEVLLSVPGDRNVVAILNQSSILYLSGVAAAIDRGEILPHEVTPVLVAPDDDGLEGDPFAAPATVTEVL